MIIGYAFNDSFWWKMESVQYEKRNFTKNLNLNLCSPGKWFGKLSFFFQINKKWGSILFLQLNSHAIDLICYKKLLIHALDKRQFQLFLKISVSMSSSIINEKNRCRYSRLYFVLYIYEKRILEILRP